MDEKVNQVGAYLRSVREAQRLSQTELARLAGTKQSIISELETNARPFTIHYAELLWRFLGVEWGSFLVNTGLLDIERLTEDEQRAALVEGQYPQLVGFLARLERLGNPTATARFFRAMDKYLELEEEEAAHDNGTAGQGGRQLGTARS